MTSTDSDPAQRPDALRKTEGAAPRAAFGRLATVLFDIATTADRSARRRCPHRGVKSRCRYRAPCRNQVAARAGTVCGGDRFVRFDPAADEPA
jgi:hypothetical protein